MSRGGVMVLKSYLVSCILKPWLPQGFPSHEAGAHGRAAPCLTLSSYLVTIRGAIAASPCAMQEPGYNCS